MTDPRPLLSSGHFFPESPEVIRDIFSGYEQRGVFPLELRPSALLLPHGAVSLCGSATVPLIRLLSRDFPGNIMLVGSVHREFSDTLWLPPYGGFETPFGPLACDGTLVADVAKKIPSALSSELPFEEEPCFDLILTALGSCGFTGRILPILAGSSSRPVKKALDKLLNKLVGEEGYFPVVSANFRLSPETGEEEAICGELLLESLRAYFSDSPFRWYHGMSTGYSAGFCDSSRP